MNTRVHKVTCPYCGELNYIEIPTSTYTSQHVNTCWNDDRGGCERVAVYIVQLDYQITTLATTPAEYYCPEIEGTLTTEQYNQLRQDAIVIIAQAEKDGHTAGFIPVDRILTLIYTLIREKQIPEPNGHLSESTAATWAQRLYDSIKADQADSPGPAVD